MSKKQDIKDKLHLFTKKTRHSQKEGMKPGSLVYVGDTPSHETKIQWMSYNSKTFRKEKDIEVIPEPGHVTWVQVTGLKDIGIIDDLGTRFGINKLFLEDILDTDQRAKVERMDKYLFAIIRLTHPENPGMMDEQISLVMSKDFLITFQERESDLFAPIIKRLEAADSLLRKQGTDVLAHAILDMIVDKYLVIADYLESETSSTEDIVVNNSEKIDASTIYKKKQMIQDFRRAVLPLREMFNQLSSGTEPLIGSSAKLFFKDTYDHVIWLIETLDNLRETMRGIMEVYSSTIGMRMNHIMQILTIISTVFIPLTFITGVYGMNFEFMPPETQAKWGFYGIIGTCILMSVGMAMWFKHKKWW